MRPLSYILEPFPVDCHFFIMGAFLLTVTGQVTMDMESTFHQHPASNESATWHSGRYWQPKGIPTPHPCGNFSYPPPPHDKKRTGPRPCPVCYVPAEQAMDSMPTSLSVSPVLRDLNYVIEETSVKTELEGGSTFGGHPTLQQRNESFDIKESMTVHCGFVKGMKPGRGTLFDINDADLLEMEQCHGIVVASAIFGNYDIMQHPKNINEATKRSACFYMFVDEETAAYINNSTELDRTKRVGLWRVVVVRNLPYDDPRRNGKVPKLLLHRLFPNIQYSIWIDGKLELVVDPHLILERLLWRENATFAISRHYKRFDVFEEGKANKAAKKYDSASIDAQLEFYRREGLTHYSPDKLPITSDVPEGCVIVREHIPITNLFTCLWFNEVDRFTSRDQLSFSTVRDKIMAKVDLKLNMFDDCQRRNFVNQVYHKDVMRQKSSPPPRLSSNIESRSSNSQSDRTTRFQPGKPVRNGRYKKPRSRCRHSGRKTF
ncbi:uncharacterized protein LOC120108662 [Phoenix dactylifera]|uniref:Uncharacterized protein LOC120108662 n=1 Tax=Phoenix dactylifera TaxID=42345 RepID=A0A8B8ZVE3_PHODC|nr:uncharacterized protein LOC120108662 [Phoenix dactylifera]